MDKKSPVKFLKTTDSARERWRRRWISLHTRRWLAFWRKVWPHRKRPLWFRLAVVFIYYSGKEAEYNARHPQYLSDFDA